MNHAFLYLAALLLLFPDLCTGQVPFRVMSYNVENLFDTDDDPATDDNEFLPAGSRRWTQARYHRKLQQTAKVITAAGEWDTPALVALCEVENDSVLTHLLRRTPLRQQHYRYCLTHGSDTRGINVALLYQRDKFRHIGHRPIPIPFLDSRRRTRDILHVWGEIACGDTLDVAVCHFPSKYGGEKESEPRRMLAARVLRKLCDSLAHVRRNPLLLVMGDFNDPPDSKCMQYLSGTSLCNLMSAGNPAATRGSHKYQGDWYSIDQILIHCRMQTPEACMQLVPRSARVFDPPFLLRDDKTWLGKRPLRTYYGFKYEGGFSDHLPVIADFNISAGRRPGP
jgi:endonuclease/exonuclease/phosphatase family metal-dependent hydrolase